MVLVRTPYDKARSRKPFHVELAERGYIVAIQDTRGRFNSDGVFFPYRDDRTDGFDTVEWVAAQDWCSGSVGMLGRSYVGQTQWFAAADDPPHLKAIVPLASPPDAFFNEPILNGCFLLPMGEWMLAMGRRSFQSPDFGELFSEPQPYFDALPLSSLPEPVRDGVSLVGRDDAPSESRWPLAGLLLPGCLAEDVGRGPQCDRLVGHELPRRSDQFRRDATTGQDAHRSATRRK